MEVQLWLDMKFKSMTETEDVFTQFKEDQVEEPLQLELIFMKALLKVNNTVLDTGLSMQLEKVNGAIQLR